MGAELAAGQIVAAIDASPDGADAPGPHPRRRRAPAAGDWDDVLRDIRELQGSPTPASRRAPTNRAWCASASRGKLTCRERIDLLLDAGSFREVGSVAGFASYDDDGRVAEFTPANHVGGWGTIEARPAVVCADDFTSRGGHADGAIGGKSGYLDRLSLQLRMPVDPPAGRLVRRRQRGGHGPRRSSRDGESAGQGELGAPSPPAGRGSPAAAARSCPATWGTMFAEQLATVPVVNVLLGSVVGIGAAKAVLGHFSVMVRDIAQLFVAGPPVVSHAMGYDITKEDLGDWRVHCRNGSVDNLAETEEEAAAAGAPVPLLPALQRLRGAAGDGPAPRRPADRREEELVHSSPASAPPPSTSAAPSG